MGARQLSINLFRHARATLVKAVGGPARLRVIALLALVLGLDSANNGTVGAITVPLQGAFHISNTQIGLLVTLSSAVGTLATLPCGVLTDHVNRTRMLWIAIVTWSVAMALSGAATGYGWLLACRVALGAVVAVAGPVVASLIGDFFPPRDRARVYGFVLAGEMLGAAAGLVVSGGIAGLSWRLGFWWLAAVGIVLAVVVAKMLPEPARGGAGRLRVGATHIVTAEEAAAGRGSLPVDDSPAGHFPAGHPSEHSAVGHPSAEDPPAGHPSAQDPPAGRPSTEDPTAEDPPPGDHAGAQHTETQQDARRSDQDNVVAHQVLAQHVQPHRELVLHENPQLRSPLWALRYVLSIRTNVVLITASSFGYFFLTGLGTFGVALVRGRFQLAQFPATMLVGVIGAGALVGTLVAGPLADWLVGRGHIGARITVSGAAMLVTAGFAAPALLSHTLVIMVGLACVGAIGLGGANPPLDAARLDVMHSRLWGRAEAVRTLMRSASAAAAPLLFGYVSTRLGGPRSGGGLKKPTALQAASAAGLDHTFLIMLAPLLIAGTLILLVARRTYPRDVATAVASERATSQC